MKKYLNLCKFKFPNCDVKKKNCENGVHDEKKKILFLQQRQRFVTRPTQASLEFFLNMFDETLFLQIVELLILLFSPSIDIISKWLEIL